MCTNIIYMYIRRYIRFKSTDTATLRTFKEVPRIDLCFHHFPAAVTLSSYCTLFPSSRPVIPYACMFLRSDNCVISFDVNKRFGLIDKSQKWLMGTKMTGSKGEISNTISSIIYGTPFYGISGVTYESR
jgi:hypothetical protein